MPNDLHRAPSRRVPSARGTLVRHLGRAGCPRPRRPRAGGSAEPRRGYARARWSEHFTVNAPNNRVVAGQQGNLDTFVRSGIIDFSRFDRSIEYVRADGPFVVIMGLETVVARADAPTAGLVAGQEVRRRFTNIWRTEGDTWRLYWRHANVIPAR